MAENDKHKVAFEIYRSLGTGRSIAKVSDATGHTRANLTIWRDKYKWEDRMSEAEKTGRGLEKLEDASILLLNSIKRDVTAMMGKCQSIIDECFEEGDDGSVTPMVHIASITDLTKMMRLQTELLTMQQGLSTNTEKPKKKTEQNRLADKITIIMNDLSPEQKLELLKGGDVLGNDTGRSKGIKVDVQEASYTDIHGDGSED